MKRIALGVLLLAGVSGPAIAQDAATSSAPSTTPQGQVTATDDSVDSGGISDIVVTAERRSENVQKSSLAISVLTADSLVEAAFQARRMSARW